MHNIPQGSYLGPLLFKFYIKNSENCLADMNPNMYADDVCIDPHPLRLTFLIVMDCNIFLFKIHYTARVTIIGGNGAGHYVTKIPLAQEELL